MSAANFDRVRSTLVAGVKGIARSVGIEIGRYRKRTEGDVLSEIFDALRQLRDRQVEGRDDNCQRFVEYCRSNLSLSNAQLLQDLLVLFVLAEKRNGYFVEFGATDGQLLSNTLLLERAFGWTGVLAEPARSWHAALLQNRNVSIDLRCVWSETGKMLEFSEARELSTVSAFKSRDGHRAARGGGAAYEVETVSLGDLLAQHDAPHHIDYLSVDTEGSEFSILRGFDFGRYDISIITVEHNFAYPDRDEIFNLLCSCGYKRIFTALSKWDDWYVTDQIYERYNNDR